MKPLKISLIVSAVLFAIINKYAFAQSKVPTWFLTTFHKNQLEKKYELSAYRKPYFLLADFNGDKRDDVAALVIDKTTKKKGILIIHAESKSYYLFGAGNDNTNGGADFKWLDKWGLYKEKEAGETIYAKDGDIIDWKTHKLLRPAIILWDVEDGYEYSGGVLYWNGKRYIWYQQGE